VVKTVLDDHELDLILAASAAINAICMALIELPIIKDEDARKMMEAAEEVLECAYICKRRTQTRVGASAEQGE